MEREGFTASKLTTITLMKRGREGAEGEVNENFTFPESGGRTSPVT